MQLCCPLVMLRAVSAQVLLLDDHPGVLRQVADLLRGGFEVVAALNDAAKLPEAMERHHPDLVVLDITLPGASGIELASRLRSTGYSGKVVFLTVHDDADYARAGFAAGGIGYVVKARVATDLLPALEAALAGQRYVSPVDALRSLQDMVFHDTHSAVPNGSTPTNKLKGNAWEEIC